MTKNLKGGYKIVSLKGNDLTSESAFTVKGLYEDLRDSYSKPILLSEIVIDDEKQQDAYAVVKKTESGYTIDVYGYALTVTDEDSVTSEALPEITSIGDGLTLEDGELSASGGGGGGSLYLHIIKITGTENGQGYGMDISLSITKATSFTNISDVIDYLYANKTGDTNVELVANGYFSTNGLINGFRISGTKPTTEIQVNCVNNLQASSTNIKTITVANISTFVDIVMEV